MTPLVTIGIPTLNRPRLLERALTSVARQSYPNLEVLVADNAGRDNEAAHVVDSFRNSIPRLAYFRHASNIGAINNFFFLLRSAQGRYFMWLADDDEISASYVSGLVDLLERNSNAASAAGNWMLMSSEQDGVLMPTSNYPQSSVLARALRFIWKSDDAFFYGLHRTDLLRQASFKGYWWPNQLVLMNWAYVFLLDMVLSGPILIAEDRSVQFINHDYTSKIYIRAKPLAVNVFMYLLRRINVHYLYWEKCVRAIHPLGMPIVLFTSLAAICRESGERIAHRLKRLGQSHVSC